MSIGTQIVWKHVESSETIEAEIDRLANKLAERCDRITSSRITIEAPSAHHKHGASYHVHLQVVIPGSNINVHRDHHTELLPAIHELYSVAERQVNETMAIQRAREQKR